jgi:hypothetical protein
MLTTTEVNRLKADIDKHVSDMERLLPIVQSNTGEIAVRYWFYNWLEKQVEGKLRRIVQQAIRAGVIFDHKKHPEPPFTERVVYSDDTTEIRLQVNAPGSRIDVDTLMNLLIAGKFIDHTQLTELADKATKVTSPAHKFSSSLIEDMKERAGPR